MRFLRALSVAHMLGIAGAILAAAIEVESIVVSGPLLSASGLILAWLSRSRRAPHLKILGLSTVAISLFVFVLINAMEWGPQQAYLPVLVIMLFGGLMLLLLGYVGVIAALRPAPDSEASPGAQIHLRSLMILVLGAAVSLAATRMALVFENETMVALAIGLCAATLFAIGRIALQGRWQAAADCKSSFS